MIPRQQFIHTRWSLLPVGGGFKVALMLACIFVTLLSGVSGADAQSGAQRPVTAVPAGSGPELRSQTVDVDIRQDQVGVWADSRISLRLTNASAQPVTATLSLPGPEIISGTMPADLQLSVDGEGLSLNQSPDGAVAQVEVAAKGQVVVQIAYRQLLPESAGLVTLAYPISAAAQWSGVPESLRVTVKFPGPVPAEQIMGQSPADGKDDGQAFTWHWEWEEPATDVWLAFMSPAWWAAFDTARTAAAAPTAGPAEHLALSRSYQQLASLPAPGFQPDADFYGRYYPAAVAALQAATSIQPAAGEAVSPDLLAAHIALSELYRAQAQRAEADPTGIYMQLAAQEAEAALLLGAPDAALRDLVTDVYLQMAARARADGDTAGAEAYLARLAKATGAEQSSVVAEEGRAAQLQVAAEQAERGNLEAARRLLVEAVGPQSVDVSGGDRPLAGQAILNVATGDGTRSISLRFADIKDAAMLQGLLGQAADALAEVPGVRSSSGADTLSVEFTFALAVDLPPIQRRLAGALPDAPELALLKAALEPEQITIGTDETTFLSGWRYGELVRLAPAAARWEGLAGRMEAAAAEALAHAAEVEGTDASIAQIQHALWTADAAVWRDLVITSRAEYRVMHGSETTLREWQLSAGAERLLQAESAVWRFERVEWLGGGLALVLLLVSVVIWRLL